jgi:exodeoxyribonuclease VII small subunit
MSEPTRQSDDVPFEEALERLDEIVVDMEAGQLPLDDMVNLFEEGATLLLRCRARLDNARNRVEKITADLDSLGKASLSPFQPQDDDAADDDDESPKPARAKRGKTDKSTDEI